MSSTSSAIEVPPHITAGKLSDKEAAVRRANYAKALAMNAAGGQQRTESPAELAPAQTPLPEIDATIVKGPDFATSALLTWAKLHPDPAATLRQRIATIDGELAGLVERATTYCDGLHKTLRTAASWVRSKRILATRLATIEGAAPPAADPAAEVTALIRSVPQWRDPAAIEVERQGAITRHRRDLAAVELTIRGMLASVHHHRASRHGSDEHQAGLTTADDTYIALMQENLEARADLSARLAPLGDPSRRGTDAELIATVRELIGGPK